MIVSKLRIDLTSAFLNAESHVRASLHRPFETTAGQMEDLNVTCVPVHNMTLGELLYRALLEPVQISG